MAKSTEEIIAAAKAAGVEVTVSKGPEGQGEIVLLPGLRAKKNGDGNQHA